MRVYVFDMRLCPRPTDSRGTVSSIVRGTPVQYRRAMARAKRTPGRDLRSLIWATALVFCSAQSVGELHMHDAGMPDEFCTACSLLHADLAGGRADPSVDARSWVRPASVVPSRADIVSRRFETQRSRAPPLGS